MQLLNIGFAILVIKVTICILPGVLGIFMLTSSEEKKREIRNSICSRAFGVSNAIAMPKFTRAVRRVGCADGWLFDLSFLVLAASQVLLGDYFYSAIALR